MLRGFPFVRLEKTPRLRQSGLRQDGLAGQDRRWRRPSLFPEQPGRRGN